MEPELELGDDAEVATAAAVAAEQVRVLARARADEFPVQRHDLSRE
jgi:hypothetical protein